MSHRPQWNHTAVKTDAAADVIEDVKQWAISTGSVAESVDPDQFKAVVTLAIIESADAYDAARYLDTVTEWPVDADLVRTLDYAYRAMPSKAKEHVKQWVLDEQIRFPAQSGEGVRFRLGNATLTGVVTELIRTEARALVSVPTKHGIQTIPVDAEDVKRVVDPPEMPKSGEDSSA